MHVTYDACILHPAGLRDLLVRLANTGMFRAHWSDLILDEMVRSIRKRRPELSPDRLDRTRYLMSESIPDVLVIGFEHLIDGLALPDPGDRHVLAVAIHSGSQVIVTENIADFPARELERFAIEAQTSDEFVANLIEDHASEVVRVLEEQAAALISPVMSYDEVLERLARSGLQRSVAALRAL